MTDAGADPDLSTLAERCWRSLDALHVTVYFAPEPTQAYGELGIRPRAGYFISRSAPMGAVSPGVTAATFYVFAPGLVAHVMGDCWTSVTPEQVLTARHTGITAALRRVLPDAEASVLVEAAELTRQLTGGMAPHGRPLYAGHAALPWPDDDPMLALWHGASLLREYRGDAHMGALLQAGAGPVEALVADAADSGRFEFLSTTRGWSAEEWVSAAQALTDRGLLTGGTGADATLTDAGQAWRADIDAATRASLTQIWADFGADRTARLLELVQPLARAVAASGILPAMIQRTR